MRMLYILSGSIHHRELVQVAQAATLCSLVFAPLPDLSLVTTLDGIDRAPRTTRFTGYEKYTVLFCQKRVWRLASLACNVLD